MDIIVYGLGDNFIKNYPWIKEGYNIVGLADGNKSKQGLLIDGFEVMSPNDIMDTNYDCILITPNASEEIQIMLQNLGVHTDKIKSLHEIVVSDNVGNDLHVCFELIGGWGDICIAVNYLYCMMIRFDNPRIHVTISCSYDNIKLAEYLLQDITSINQFILESNEEHILGKYDLLVRLDRYPEIIKSNNYKISRLVPELIDYILLCEKYKIFNPRHYIKGYKTYGENALLEEICARKRIQQPDIYGFLGIDEEFVFTPYYDNRLLDKWNLADESYITIHHGFGGGNAHNKLNVKQWREDYYIELIHMLKEKFPKTKLVMLGMIDEKIDADVDYNLCGQMDINELMTILANSRLHIDTEGGLVHLRHALKGGCSVVLFGPTSPDFFGYSENINIRTNDCKYPCEWLVRDWFKNCVREDGKRIICMSSITPYMVMREIEEAKGLKYEI